MYLPAPPTPLLTLSTCPLSPPSTAAAGKTQPPAADVQKLTSLICSDPESAGDQIRTAVQAGGSQAQVAVYALFTADCASEDAASDAYGAWAGWRRDGKSRLDSTLSGSLAPSRMCLTPAHLACPPLPHPSLTHLPPATCHQPFASQAPPSML